MKETILMCLIVGVCVGAMIVGAISLFMWDCPRHNPHNKLDIYLGKIDRYKSKVEQYNQRLNNIYRRR
jgi:hypothetical protein